MEYLEHASLPPCRRENVLQLLGIRCQSVDTMQEPGPETDSALGVKGEYWVPVGEKLLQVHNT